MDCLRLFTKEDVLDGDEKPVGGVRLGERGGGLPRCRLGPFPSMPVLSELRVWSSLCPHSCLCLFVSNRHVVAAKPGRGAQRNSTSRSSPRSWCFVSFGQRDSARGYWWGGRQFLTGSPSNLGSLTQLPRPEALLRGQDTNKQAHHFRQLPAEGSGPPGVCLTELQ